jgi:hypothetical protein
MYYNKSNIHVFCKYIETFSTTLQCLFSETPRDLHRTFGTFAFVFCPTVVAQERNGWELDSLRGNPPTFPSRMPSRFMRSYSKCWIAGMPTISRGIWRCIGNRRNCWCSWIPSSLTAGSNCTIIPVSLRYNFAPPSFLKTCLKQHKRFQRFFGAISHNALLGTRKRDRPPGKG